MKQKVLLEGLHCSNCALQIEEKLQSSGKFGEGFINFANSTLYLENKETLTQEELAALQKLVDDIEPGTKVHLLPTEEDTPAPHDHEHTHVHTDACNHDHDHDHDHVHSGACNHDHDHSHDHVHSDACNHDHDHDHSHAHTDKSPVATSKTTKLFLDGLHCSNCALQIEEKMEKEKAYSNTFVNFASSTLYVDKDAAFTDSDLQRIQKIVDDIEPGTKVSIIQEDRAPLVNISNKTTKLFLDALHCSNCALQIEEKMEKEKAYSNAFVNFASSTLYVDKDTAFTDSDLQYIQKIVDDIEPGTKVSIIQEERPELERMSTCDDGSCDVQPVAAAPKTVEEIKQKATEKSGLAFIHYAFFTAVIAFVGAFFLPTALAPWVVGASSLLAGYDILYKGITGIPKGRIDENLLMTVAAIGAFIIGEYNEGALVMLLFKAGLLLEEKAVNASRRSIAALTDIQAENATILQNGSFVTVPSKQVRIGDILMIRPGEKIPVDCVITKGATTVDNHALTGESVPVNAVEDDVLQSGGINLTGAIEARATATFHNSTASRIIELVELSASKKSTTQNFITRFARVYTPIVLLMAFAVALVPPALGFGALNDWVYKALIFTVSACPCALVIATPLGFFSGVGAASKKGVLIKGSKYLEALAKADAFVFDKTGTITSGELTVSEIAPLGDTYSQDGLLQLCASVQQFSNHPIAKTIVASYQGETIQDVTDFQDIVGMGVKAKVNGKEVLCGSKKLMEKHGISLPQGADANILLSFDGKFIGQIMVSDKVKDTSITATAQLKALGAQEIVVLTGDSEHAGQQAKLACPSIDTVYASLLPGDKVDRLEEIKKRREKTVFVGDGINDAPVLASSDIGVAMGFGSDAAIEAADAVLMSDSLVPIVDAVKISRQTMGIIKFNIYFALLTKVAVVGLGLFGLATTWMAVFADVGVTILSVLNTSRILKKQ